MKYFAYLIIHLFRFVFEHDPRAQNESQHPQSTKLNNLNCSHWQLCLATMTQNFKWVKITDICLI